MNEKEEIMELKHDPVPGYRPAFFIIFGVSLVYLVIIFFMATPTH